MVDLEVEVDEEKVGAIPYTYFEVSQETKDALEAKANEFVAFAESLGCAAAVSLQLELTKDGGGEVGLTVSKNTDRIGWGMMHSIIAWHDFTGSLESGESVLYKHDRVDTLREKASKMSESSPETYELVNYCHKCGDIDGTNDCCKTAGAVVPIEVAQRHHEAHHRLSVDMELPQRTDLTRYCPECGHIGEVPEGKIDCCPDGSHAELVPLKFAERCRTTFQIAIHNPSKDPLYTIRFASMVERIVGKKPPARFVHDWVEHESEDLQIWAADNVPFSWMTGISILDAAHALVNEAHGCATKSYRPHVRQVMEELDVANQLVAAREHEIDEKHALLQAYRSIEPPVFDRAVVSSALHDHLGQFGLSHIDASKVGWGLCAKEYEGKLRAVERPEGKGDGQ